ncbi:MAG: shikimate kinase [bacterium]
MADNNIILIGFMGAGKTEAGRILAKNSGFNFLDIDALIEKLEGITITDIFKKKGEQYFRDLETKILKEMKKNKSDISKAIEKYTKGSELAIKESEFNSDSFIALNGKGKPWVISTGGGAPAFNGNLKLIKNIGTVIYLKADAKTIYERIKSEIHRPVFGAGGFTLKSVRDKLKEREKFYGQADMIIYTDGLSINGVAEEIEIFLSQN